MLGHECPAAVSPTRGVVLTDLQSSLIVNKLLSLSLSPSLPPSFLLLLIFVSLMKLSPSLLPLGRTESGGIVLAANAGPRVPSGGVTLKRPCTHRPSVISLIVNKLLSLPPPHRMRWVTPGGWIQCPHALILDRARHILML
jgi:hypothetical protein